MKFNGKIACLIGLAAYVLLGTLALIAPGLFGDRWSAYLFEGLLVFAPALLILSSRFWLKRRRKGS